jgi:HEAT repeat protein
MKRPVMFALVFWAMVFWAALGPALGATPAAAEERPQVVNGKVVEQAPSGTLGESVQRLARSGQTAWVGYSVPVTEGQHHMCCFNARSEFRGNRQCCGGCRLESGNADNFIADSVDHCAAPDFDSFFVLARVAGGTVEKIRPASADCGLDLGGLTLYWLGAAKPAESVAWLAGFVPAYESEERSGRHRADSALTAIAFHQDAAAETALERFLAPQQPRKLREQAAFWLGSARGQRGFEAVRNAIRNDADSKFREEATFALSESAVPGAEQELVRVARQDRDGEVRSQALFWLAQKAGEKAVGPINDAIENDPDTEVKKKAVFALSEMEHNEGVPLLIQVVRTNKNPVVRKEALFWLGQSNDPRALDYIESILKQ